MILSSNGIMTLIAKNDTTVETVANDTGIKLERLMELLDGDDLATVEESSKLKEYFHTRFLVTYVTDDDSRELLEEIALYGREVNCTVYYKEIDDFSIGFETYAMENDSVSDLKDFNSCVVTLERAYEYFKNQESNILGL